MGKLNVVLGSIFKSRNSPREVEVVWTGGDKIYYQLLKTAQGREPLRATHYSMNTKSFERLYVPTERTRSTDQN